ncbi:MAG TPA: tetratricopeptide repeat protein [Terracidiphilus sp.]|nr:tetratricopeptide repeat protein [Terracidiphilus sp.]
MPTSNSSFVRVRAVLVLLVSLAALLPAAAVAESGGEAYRQTVLSIQQHIQSGDLDGAQALLGTALGHFPADGGLENLLGVVEIQQGHADRARKAFASAIRHSPRLVSAYLNLGRVDMETAANSTADRVEALRAYEGALKLEPGNAEANYQAATLLMWAGQYQRSVDRLAKLKPEEQQQIGVIGLFCVDEAALGHIEEARQRAAVLDASPELNEQLAMILLPGLKAARRADLIVPMFLAIDTRGGLSASGLHILGLAQEAVGELKAARATLERCYARDPSSVVPLVDLARVAESSGDQRGALGYLAHARTMEPKNAELPYLFGVVCAKMNLLGEARKAFGEAVALDPADAQYNLAMGTVASFGHDPLASLSYLQKYHELRPADPVGMLALGQAYFRAKDYDHATPWLQKAASLPRTAARALYYLGRIARDKDNVGEALRDLIRSDKLAPRQPEVMAEIGQIYVETKRYAEAQKELDAALALDQDNYAANFGLLQLYARTQDARLQAEQKRFEAVKNKREEESREMMRVIEIDPKGHHKP